jgi:hypothetical protein
VNLRPNQKQCFENILFDFLNEPNQANQIIVYNIISLNYLIIAGTTYSLNSIISGFDILPKRIDMI